MYIFQDSGVDRGTVSSFSPRTWQLQNETSEMPGEFVDH